MNRLSSSSIKDMYNDMYNDMKSKKTEIRHFILDEVQRTQDYLDEITTIEVFECDDCGAELTYNEYQEGGGSCYKCGGY